VGSDEVVAVLEGLARDVEDSLPDATRHGVNGVGFARFVDRSGAGGDARYKDMSIASVATGPSRACDMNSISERFDSFTSTDLNLISKYGIQL
jgi:hypothetical protein